MLRIISKIIAKVRLNLRPFLTNRLLDLLKVSGNRKPTPFRGERMSLYVFNELESI